MLVSKSFGCACRCAWVWARVAPSCALRFVLHLDRDKTHLSVLDVALGDHRLGKFPDRGGAAAQDGDFEAIVVVEMNMHRRDLKIVMIVMCVRQSLRQFARVVIEDVGQGCDALSLRVVIDPRLLETEAGKVAQRLGSILVAVIVHEGGKFGGELVGHADGDPLHVLSLSNSAIVEATTFRRSSQTSPPGTSRSALLASLVTPTARRLADGRGSLAGMAVMMTVIDRVAVAMMMSVGDMRADAQRRVVEDFARRARCRQAPRLQHETTIGDVFDDVEIMVAVITVGPSPGI